MNTSSLPAPTAIQIPGPSGAIRGIAWAWPASDLGMLFLHDLDADLDAVRWLAEPVAAAGISVLAVDLLGHGLSDGHRRSAVGAVDVAYQTLRHEVTGAAAVVAQGRAAGLLLRRELRPAPTAAVLIGPVSPVPVVSGTAKPRIAPGWRLVPKLIVVPEATQTMDRYATQVLDATNAWCLRADLAGLGEEEFARQVTSLTVKFALEQAAFELSAKASDEVSR